MGDVEEGTDADIAAKRSDKQATPAKAAANNKPVTPTAAATAAAAAATSDKQLGAKEHAAARKATQAVPVAENGVTPKNQNPSSPAPNNTAHRQGADKSAADKAPAGRVASGTAVASTAEAGKAAQDQPAAPEAAEKAASTKSTATAAKETTAVVKAARTAPAGATAAASAQKPGDAAATKKKSAVAAASGSSGRPAKTPAAGKSSGAADAASNDAASTPAAGDSSAAAGAGSSAAAAAAGLPNDPSCTPGTIEFEIAAKKVRETLEVYKARTKLLLQSYRAKPDMIAYKELRLQHTPAERYGHIPGVRVGQEFLGRGELAILGLHTSMMRGIMSKKGKPAYAIAMSGGYKDDADSGQMFWYTGQGGQKAGRQAENQSYAAPDNAALVDSYKANAPVRVFRGKVGANGERLYVYEGLYKVAAHKMEKSQDGPLVCKFQMVGIPGHFVVSGTVEYKCLLKSQFQAQLLARRPAARPGKKRGRSGEVKLVTRAEMEARVQQRQAAGRHGRLVTPDLSEGQEKLPIPVWNAVDDEDSILLQLGQQAEQPDPSSMEEEQPVFVYTRDYKFGEEEAKQLAIAAEKTFNSSFPGTCGIQYAGKEEGSYNEDGLMLSTQPFGIMECDEECKHSKLCKLNRVVSEGIRYPLEVFKVNREVGWGVRCSEDLPVGAFVCCYIGLVITDDWADKLRHQDLYLFDLNHFHMLWDVDDSCSMPEGSLNPNLHQLQGELRAKHLVIDANRQGNVGRFINHSCDPNCVVQTVFAGNARSQLLYYVAIVAMKDIPAYSELTYDYGYSKTAAAEAGAHSPAGDAASSRQECKSVRIRCQCGSAACRQSLL